MATSFNPQTQPVVGVDAHLPPVPAAALRPEALRDRFRAPPAWTPEITVERRIIEREPTHAAVLIGLVEREAGLTVLLTRRTEHLNAHPGQISFAGGRSEPEDADAAATALREADDEIGLDARFVEVLGTLPLYTTGTGFIVTPVVALVREGFTVKADPFEVADVFEVPLDFVMTPANHRHHAVETDGVRREYLSMPWNGRDAEGRPRRYFIWGATAAMIRNLYRFLVA